MDSQPPTQACLELVVQHLCRAIRTAPPGSRFSFFWNAQNPRLIFGPRGVTFYIDEEQIERASLGLLVEQAQLLAGTPVDEVRSILLEFFRFHLHLFEHGASRPGPTANELAAALLAYIHEIRQDKLYLIPARRLALARDHIGSRLVLSRPTDPMLSAMATVDLKLPCLNGRQFPPFAWDKTEGQLLDTDCWIGCVASSDQQAYGILEAVLGAVSLILPPRRSRVFSMAGRIPYIYCMGGRWQARLDGPTFPPVIDDHELGDGDITALQSLFEGTRDEKAQQRIELGLQFAGAGWARPGRLGFLHNAIAFDALFGEKGRVRVHPNRGGTSSRGHSRHQRADQPPHQYSECSAPR